MYKTQSLQSTNQCENHCRALWMSIGWKQHTLNVTKSDHFELLSLEINKEKERLQENPKHRGECALRHHERLYFCVCPSALNPAAVLLPVISVYLVYFRRVDPVPPVTPPSALFSAHISSQKSPLDLKRHPRLHSHVLSAAHPEVLKRTCWNADSVLTCWKFHHWGRWTRIFDVF